MLFATAALVGCRKGDSGAAPNGGSTSDDGGDGIEVSVAASSGASVDEPVASSRAYLDGSLNYFWKRGDCLGLFALSADGTTRVVENIPMTYNGSEPSATAVFDGKLDVATYKSMPLADYQYFAYYPHKSTDSGLTLSDWILSGLTLPSVQTVAGQGSDNFQSQYDFMVSPNSTQHVTLATTATSGVSLDFKHLFSAVQFSVPSDKVGGQSVREITLTAPEGTALTGGFTVDVRTGKPAFTTPSNKVTVHIEGTGLACDGSADARVWAIINPVDLSAATLTIDVTTVSCYKFSYTFTGASYTAAHFHKQTFIIPAPTVTMNNVYTSYTLKNNSLDGKTIYTADNKVTFPVGYTLVSPITETGVVYGSDKRANATPELAFSKDATNMPLGSYDVCAYATAAGITFKSATTTVYVTGIPYNISFDSGSPSGWTTSNTETYYSVLGFKPTDAYVVSPKFYVPSNTDITVAVMARAYHSVAYRTYEPIVYVSASTTGVAGIPSFTLSSTIETGGSYALHSQDIVFTDSVAQTCIFVRGSATGWDICRTLFESCLITYKK